MALLALGAAASIALVRGLSAQSPSASQEVTQDQEPRQSAPPPPTASRPADAPIPTVRLNLVIAGLGRAGCDVEVKPGNASCRFRVLSGKGVEGRQHVPSTGTATVELREIEIRNADKICTVSITVHEPGQEKKTVYRGFRVGSRPSGKASSAAAAVPTFTCFLSSPSKLARVDNARTRK
jgi:hypothetical protein